MEINEIKYGFKLLSIKEIPDVDGVLYEYEHLKSGGKVAYLRTDDDDCSFAIGFKTPPKDSTGVCHIIEHSVLCGSANYPLKEPFVNLLKTSVNTFLNAFTSSDWTMYPFSSRTPKDYDNILGIYLDAVFNPLLLTDSKPFLQEGWHHELFNKEDPINVKGVVYNEMKGAMSDPLEVLSEVTETSLLGGTCYQYNSGGDPDCIPSLTYENYRAFYKEHYTPENSIAFIYGNLNVEDKLKFMDENYYSKFERTGVVFDYGTLNKVQDLNVESEYELGENEDTKDNYYIKLGYGFDYNVEEIYALNLVLGVLLDNNNSPLKKALLSKKLGEDILSSVNNSSYYPYISFTLTKTNENQKSNFRKVLHEELKKICDTGIDKGLILAAINKAEFDNKEKNTGGYPKGIIYSLDVVSASFYGIPLEECFDISKIYKLFRERLNTSYFEKLLEKYILNSNHYVSVLLKPNKEIGKIKESKLNKELEEYKASLSDKEIDKLIEQTNILVEYQNHVDTKKELKCLPSLKISDINLGISWIDEKKAKWGGLKGYTLNKKTNGITYLNLLFDSNSLTIEDFLYFKVLFGLYFNSKTKNYSEDELKKYIDTYIGRINITHSVLVDKEGNPHLYIYFTIAVLDENIEYVSKVINEVVYNSKFGKDDVLNVIKQIASGAKNSIINSGSLVARTVAGANVTKASALMDGISGLNSYRFYTELSKNYDHKAFLARIKELVKKVFRRDNLSFFVLADGNMMGSIESEIKNIKLNRKKYDSAMNVELSGIKSKSIVIPSGVSYNAAALPIDNSTMTFGSGKVLSQIVTFDYLWSEIRVKGGAYGCGLTLNKADKVLYLSTYRDPNVKNSYEVFNNLASYIDNLKLTKEEFNGYVISVLGTYGIVKSNDLLLLTEMNDLLRGYKKKDIIANKKSIKNTKYQDIKNCGEIFRDFSDKWSICTVGNKGKIDEYQFDKEESL